MASIRRTPSRGGVKGWHQLVLAIKGRHQGAASTRAVNSWTCAFKWWHQLALGHPSAASTRAGRHQLLRGNRRRAIKAPGAPRRATTRTPLFALALALARAGRPGGWRVGGLRGRPRGPVSPQRPARLRAQANRAIRGQDNTSECAALCAATMSGGPSASWVTRPLTSCTRWCPDAIWLWGWSPS